MRTGFDVGRASGDEPDQGTALEAAGGRPPPSGFTLLGEGHHTQSRPSGAGQKKSPGCEHGRGRCGSVWLMRDFHDAV